MLACNVSPRSANLLASLHKDHASLSHAFQPCRGAPAPIRRRTAVISAGWFNFGKKAVEQIKPVRETVIPEPSYNLPIALTGLAAVSGTTGNYSATAVFGLLAAFLAFQASRVQFVFDDEALEVLIKSKESENKFVGGQNRWAFDSFTNWEFWWKGFPVLVYFKETQTKPEGQIHFFPVLFKGDKLYDLLVERCGPSQTSAPES